MQVLGRVIAALNRPVILGITLSLFSAICMKEINESVSAFGIIGRADRILIGYLKPMKNLFG
jgi:hypothetical protein